MLADEIKARMHRAMRERDDVRKTILGLAFGELQTAEARANRPLTNDEAVAVVRKLVKSNEETIAVADAERGAILRREIDALAEFLPKSLTPEQIATALAGALDAIRAAKSDGQAMGVAMKHLKSAGAPAEAADVQAAVKQLRG